jgi:hypothetical protein
MKKNPKMAVPSTKECEISVSNTKFAYRKPKRINTETKARASHEAALFFFFRCSKAHIKA